jgi:hypothetical protein
MVLLLIFMLQPKINIINIIYVLLGFYFYITLKVKKKLQK